VLVGFGLVWLWLNHLRHLRSAIVERILDRVEGEVTQARLLSDSVRGRHDGRAFRMRLRTKATYRLWTRSIDRGWRFVYPLEIEIELPCAPPIELCVRRMYPIPPLERNEDRHTPEGFLRRHVVEGEAGFDPLHTAREARIALANLLGRCGLHEVSVRGGVLRAQGDLRKVGPQELNAILGELEILAREFDRRPALNIGFADRSFVWVGSDDRSARCAYCHDDLGQDDLVSCGRCHTLTHADCYGEHGGCPILGCGGHAAPLNLGKAGIDLDGLDLHSDFGSAPGPTEPPPGSGPLIPSPGPPLTLEGEVRLQAPGTEPEQPEAPELELPPEDLSLPAPAGLLDPTPAEVLPELEATAHDELELPGDADPDLTPPDDLALPPDDLALPPDDLALPADDLAPSPSEPKPPEQAPPVH